MRKPIILLFVCIAFFNACNTQADNIIPVKGMREDYRILRKCLEEAHPGLYWYSSKKSMDHFFDSIYASLNQPMSSINFFKTLSATIAKIRCVHTNVVPSKQALEMIKQFKTFPLILKFIDGKSFIWKDFGNNKNIPFGAEIISINHHNLKDIIPVFFKFLPADGYNESFKYSLLETNLFREAYAMCIEQPDEFLIEAMDTLNGSHIKFTIPSLPWQQVHENIEKANLKKTYKQTEFKILDSVHTAIFSVNTFEINTEVFNDTLRSVFCALQKHGVKNLIIDVRKNGGGNNTNVRNLFAYLAYKPFLHLKKTKMITQHFSFLQYVTNANNFKNIRSNKIAANDYDVNYLYPGTAITQPETGCAFKGKVFILAGGGTVSAASEIVILAKYNKRATIIGEETGGCYYGATGGRYLKLVLPNSKIRINIPTIRICNAVDDDYMVQPFGRGVLPDIRTTPQHSDWLQKDVELDSAIGLIGR